MRIIFTVTNDLSFDQRMIRICQSLSRAGYDVKIVGRKLSNSPPLVNGTYQQKRLPVYFKKGFIFYLEYNIRLFLYLLFQRREVYCCIDLDTMLPVFAVSLLLRKKRVYDAHEYFSQQKEVVQRPRIYRFWHFIEKTFVPRFKNGYSVSEGITDEFYRHYGVCYKVIRNVPRIKNNFSTAPKEKIIIYQGSVNEARGFEYLIPAMRQTDAVLWIFGDGNFLQQAQSLVTEIGVGEKVFFKGKFLPGQLDGFTRRAMIGVNLVEPAGKNQTLSLANKFFDYMHHGVPQVTMNFAEYRKINDEFEIAILIDRLSAPAVIGALDLLLKNKDIYERLRENCLKARAVFNWENEEKTLLDFYRKIESDMQQ